MDFISFRIAGKSYSIYGMSPLTAIRIMQARDIKKELDKSIGCLKAMTQSVALGISDSKNIFNILFIISISKLNFKYFNTRAGLISCSTARFECAGFNLSIQYIKCLPPQHKL